MQALYDEAMAQAGIDASDPLYAASGVLSLAAEGSGSNQSLLDNSWFQFCQQVPLWTLMHACICRSMYRFMRFVLQHKPARFFLLLRVVH
jgi:hypothetical protein